MSAGILVPPGALRVLVATRPVDFRKGMNGLATVVQEQLGADRVKLLFLDGSGVCLFAKRLEAGQFRWPRPGDSVMELSAAQLSALIEGLDWTCVHMTPLVRPQAAQ